MCDAMNIDVSGPDGSLTLTTRATGANQKISVRSAGANDETVIYGKMQRSPWEHSLPQPMVLAIKQMVPVL